MANRAAEIAMFYGVMAAIAAVAVTAILAAEAKRAAVSLPNAVMTAVLSRLV